MTCSMGLNIPDRRICATFSIIMTYLLKDNPDISTNRRTKSITSPPEDTRCNKILMSRIEFNGSTKNNFIKNLSLLHTASRSLVISSELYEFRNIFILCETNIANRDKQSKWGNLSESHSPLKRYFRIFSRSFLSDAPRTYTQSETENHRLRHFWHSNNADLICTMPHEANRIAETSFSWVKVSSVKNLQSTFVCLATSLIAYSTISDHQATDLRIYPWKLITELWLCQSFLTAKTPDTWHSGALCFPLLALFYYLYI